MRHIPAIWLAILVTLSGCVAERIDNASEASNSVLLVSESPVWAEYVKSFDRSRYQKECLPRYMPARGAKARGSIVLVHGFTACPQQYGELGEMLTAKGYNVFLPLIPGHGLKMDYSEESLKAAHAAIPSYDGGRKPYEAFADFLVRLGQSIPGQRTIGGLSAGGLFITRTLQRPNHGYSKGVIMTPFFGLTDRPAFIFQNLHRAVSVSKFFGGGQSLIAFIIEKGLFKRESSWGEKCETEEVGRAGYCRFQSGHVALLQVMGHDAKNQKVTGDVDLLLIGVEGDPAVSNGAIEEFARKNSFSDSGGSGRVACFFEEGVNHSLLSRFDSPSENKFWKEPLEQALVEFIADDRTMPTGPKREGTFPRCLPNRS